MSLTSLPRHADTRQQAASAVVVRSVAAALAIISVCLVATLAVRGSERVDSGWIVATPSTALDHKRPADPSIRIAINQILEQGHLLQLRPPAQPVEAQNDAPDAEPSEEPSAEPSSQADGWRPAETADDPPQGATPIPDIAPLFQTPESAQPTPAADPLAEEQRTTIRRSVPMELGPMIRAAGSATARAAARPSTLGPRLSAAATDVDSRGPSPATGQPAMKPTNVASPPASTPDDEDDPSDDADASADAEPEHVVTDSRDATDDRDTQPPVVAEPPVEPLPPLTRSMQNLRTKVRRVLKSYYSRPLNSRDDDPWELMHGMLAYGVHSRVRQGGPQGELITAVGWLCYNRPCKGLSLLYVTPEGELRAKYGVGLQGHMGQFLAMLAQCQISPEYPIRAGGQEFTIQDLVEAEMKTCYPKTELTFKLIALMHYLDSDATWVNDQGMSWDIPTLIREELAQPIRGAACGGTHRLASLSLAARTRVRRGEPLDGEYLRAAQYVEKYHNYAFQLQNRDGSLSTEWFRGRGDESDVDRRVRTTGHILEWLIYSLDDKEVRYTRTVRAVNYLTSLLSSNYNRDWEVGPLSHAIHALKLYDDRVFQPYDDQEHDIATSKAGRSTTRAPSRAPARSSSR